MRRVSYLKATSNNPMESGAATTPETANPVTEPTKGYVQLNSINSIVCFRFFPVFSLLSPAGHNDELLNVMLTCLNSLLLSSSSSAANTHAHNWIPCRDDSVPPFVVVVVVVSTGQILSVGSSEAVRDGLIGGSPAAAGRYEQQCWDDFPLAPVFRREIQTFQFSYDGATASPAVRIE